MPTMFKYLFDNKSEESGLFLFTVSHSSYLLNLLTG